MIQFDVSAYFSNGLEKNHQPVFHMEKNDGKTEPNIVLTWIYIQVNSKWLFFQNLWLGRIRIKTWQNQQIQVILLFVFPT